MKALVLSGGGMFGAYQAGAWKAVAERWQPDLIVGASAGALNGWTIAGGASPDELIDHWLDPAAGSALRLVPNPGLLRGWFDGDALRARTEEVFALYQPKIPFALTVVELPWFRTRTVVGRDVTPAHLQATCSIPYFLPTVKIDGHRFVDGGLIRRLPVQPAIDLGATEIIAIDALPGVSTPSMQRAMDFAHSFARKPKLPRAADVTLIVADGPLGTANEAVFWNRANSQRWIEQGYADAARVCNSLPFAASTK